MKHIITAVIPVRAGSRRLLNKNILPFGDSNLLIHKIRQLKSVSSIDNIVVSSDSDEMLAMAKYEGVGTHKRAPEYCDEETKTFNEVVEHIAQNVTGDSVMWAPCVCPLTVPANYSGAIKTYLDLVIDKKQYDSVISVKRFKEYLWNEKEPVNYKLGIVHVISQNLPDWNIVVNGFHLAQREDMIKWKYVYSNNSFLYVLSKREATDIDDAEDFEIAKALLNIKE